MKKSSLPAAPVRRAQCDGAERRFSGSALQSGFLLLVSGAALGCALSLHVATGPGVVFPISFLRDTTAHVYLLIRQIGYSQSGPSRSAINDREKHYSSNSTPDRTSGDPQPATKCYEHCMPNLLAVSKFFWIQIAVSIRFEREVFGQRFLRRLPLV